MRSAATSGSSRATPSSPLAEVADEVIVCTPEVERSWCHTASYTCAVAALDAIHGGDPSLARAGGRGGAPARGRGAGAGQDPRRRRGPRLADGAGGGAEAARGRVGLGRRAPDGAAAARLPRGGRRARARVRAGRRRAERPSARTMPCARWRRSAARRRSCPTRHPAVDIVRFQLLTLAVAEARGIDPDPIRRTPGSPWADAAGSAYPGV